METYLRPATNEDTEILLQFEQGVIEAERAFDPTLKSAETYYYDLPALINEPHIHLLLAIQNETPVGCGYLRIEPSKHYLQHARHGYLGFMYVVPHLRGQGLNKMIMEALEGWAREQGITELRLEVYAGNRGAVKAYEKAGFETHMIEMRKGLT